MLRLLLLRKLDEQLTKDRLERITALLRLFAAALILLSSSSTSEGDRRGARLFRTATATTWLEASARRTSSSRSRSSGASRRSSRSAQVARSALAIERGTMPAPSFRVAMGAGNFVVFDDVPRALRGS